MEGVEELDLVDTDGEYVYALSQQELYVARAWPVDEAQVVARLSLDGLPVGLRLMGDALLVLSENGWQPEDGTGVDLGTDRHHLSVVDVSDPSTPRVVRQTYRSGSLRGVSLVVDRLVVVATEDLDPRQGEDWAREFIRRDEVEGWLPRQEDHLWTEQGWQTTTETLISCEEVWLPSRPSGTSLTTVASLDLSDSAWLPEAVTLAVSADVVASDPEHLLLGWTEDWNGPWEGRDDQRHSLVHALALSPLAYLDSVRAPGALSGPETLSVHDDVLRLVTWEADLARVLTYALDEPGKPLGELELPGVSLYDALFEPERAWLGPPVRLVDLTDPSMPEVLEELDVDSSAIYRLDETRLALMSGASVTLVGAEPPQLLDEESLAAGPMATYDHRALTWAPDQGALLLATGWSFNEPGLEVVPVSAEGLGSSEQLLTPWIFSCGEVRRSLVMEDRAWAVARGGMIAVDLAQPGEPLTTVEFEDADCYW